MMPMCWRLGTWFRTIGRLLKGLSLRLPMDVSLPEAIQKVDIRVKGKERIIAPRPKLGQLLSGTTPGSLSGCLHRKWKTGYTRRSKVGRCFCGLEEIFL